MEDVEQIFVKPDIEVTIEIANRVDFNQADNTFMIKTEENHEDIHTNLIQNNYFNEKTESFSGKVYENGKINRVQCPQCDSTFKNRANLKKHIQFVHSMDSVECAQCYRIFKSIAHLRTHTNSVHAETREVSCDVCKKTFLNTKRLKNHMFYTHPKPQDSVICKMCNKSFKRQFNLKIHMRQVHPSQNSIVTCETCHKSFKNDMLLQRHVKWSHPTDGMTYKCQICGRTLPSIACFKKHLKNVHSEEEVKCKICLKSFKTVKTLLRHEKHIHGGQKLGDNQIDEPKISDDQENSQKSIDELKIKTMPDFQCLDCDRRFATKTALQWHYEMNHSENRRSTSCQMCEKSFSDYNGLKRHIETAHSIQTSQCSLCSKVFKSHIHLQNHIKTTHATESNQDCNQCQKTFKNIQHLRVHINAVHKIGLFICEICDKRFNTKTYMLKHKKTHGSKEFPCHICNKLFKAPYDVKKHTKRVHNVKNTPEDALSNCALKPETIEIETARICTKCDRRFENYVDLHMHILKCGSEIDKSPLPNKEMKIKTELGTEDIEIKIELEELESEIDPNM